MNPPPAAALFDAEVLRSGHAPVFALPPHPEPIVVVGSAFRLEWLDATALAREGITVRRRRGGGGAVLLQPEDGWAELWRPVESGGGTSELREAAVRAGARLRELLLAEGLATDVHEGGVQRPSAGAVACFAGLGPGELTVAGRKLLGISQWRVREGSLVSVVLVQREPARLARYLAEPAGPRRELEAHATCLEEVAPALEAVQLVASYVEELRAGSPGSTTGSALFSTGR